MTHEPVNDIAGTTDYYAPETREAYMKLDNGEVWDRRSISTKVDVWAFGALIFELSTGWHFWSGGIGAYNAQLIRDFRLSPWHDTLRCKELTDGFLRDVILRCFAERPGDRPSAGILLREFEQEMLR